MPRTYRRRSAHLDFLWPSKPSSGAEAATAGIEDSTMAFAADFEILFDRLSDTLRGASAPSAAPFAKIAAGSRRSAGKASRVNHLIEASAWTEAALALIELELPGWKLRRLVHENGEWL